MSSNDIIAKGMESRERFRVIMHDLTCTAITGDIQL